MNDLKSGLVNISDIIVDNRKRELGDVEPLAKSISEIGLLNPIAILKDGTLVAGLHRLEACKLLGWNQINVIVVDLNKLDAELAEIDENLIRNELHWFDRDKQLARRKEIYEIKHPTTKQGGDRKSEDAKSNRHNDDLMIPAFVKDTSAKIGVSDRTIERSIQRANIFTEKQGEILKRAAIPQTDATKLARMEEPKREAVLQKIAESPKPISVKDAVSTVRQEEKHRIFEKTTLTIEHCNIYPCAVSDLRVHVTPNSVDYIITDPPYPKEYLPVYKDLAEFASYALKSGGSLIMMIGQSYLPEIIEMLRPHLTYQWTACYFTPGPATQIWQRNVNCSFKPLLWFVKDTYTGTWVNDVFTSERRDKDFHEWGQSESGMADIINRFTLPDQVICDPFVGGGATPLVAYRMKRRFIGCDIDESYVEKALQRVREVVNE